MTCIVLLNCVLVTCFINKWWLWKCSNIQSTILLAALSSRLRLHRCYWASSAWLHIYHCNQQRMSECRVDVAEDLMKTYSYNPEVLLMATRDDAVVTHVQWAAAGIFWHLQTWIMIFGLVPYFRYRANKTCGLWFGENTDLRVCKRRSSCPNALHPFTLPTSSAFLIKVDAKPLFTCHFGTSSTGRLLISK